MLDAKITQLNAKPANINDKGETVHDEYAALTLKIPMDSLKQKEGVKALFDVLSQEWVKVKVVNEQLRLDTEASDEAAD